MAGRRFAIFSFFGLLALALAVLATSGTQAQSYKRLREYSVDPTTASALTDSIDYTASAIPDYNYEDSSMYTLTPVDLHAVMGGLLPIGAGVGTLDSDSTVGLLNGPCSTGLPTTFELYNASVDTGDVLEPADMLWVLKDKNDHPIPYGADNPQLPDYLEAYPHFLNDGLDPPDPDGAGGAPDPPPLQPRARYAGHDFVADNNILIQLLVFDPGQLKQMGGLYAELDDSVGGVTIVVLNNPVNQAEAPGSISDFCTPLETITTVFGTTTDNLETGAVNDGCIAVGGTSEADIPGACDNDNSIDDDADTKINDGCPQVGGNSEGPGAECNNRYDDDGDGDPIESGYANQSNPDPGAGVLNTGTMIARNYSRSERDADGDGWENDLDPCPYTLDPGWDPRAECLLGVGCTGDNDGDGLPNSCDPDVDGDPDDPDEIDCDFPHSTQKDCDGDGYENRQDICPLVPNGCTQTAGCGPIANPEWDNQADSESALPQNANADVGPNPDSIGDACDDSDDDGDEDGFGPGTCNDGIDNGGDTLIDGNDDECVDFMDAGEKALGNPDPDIWGANPSTGQFFHSMGWAAACVGGEECPGCVNDLDDDGDTLVNDGCPAKGAVETACDDDVDDDGDTRVNDGCVAVDDPENPDCANDTDDDGDTLVNDGCPQKGDDPETACDDAVDDDGDTNINDGCPADNSNIDADGDGYCDTFEGYAGSPADNGSEADMDPDDCAAPSCCGNAADDDGDTYVNDGCPMDGKYAERAGQCAIGNDDNDDDDPTDDILVNDGCPVIGVPETLVIDTGITLGATALITVGNTTTPVTSAAAPESCNDGIDNDGDGRLDAVDVTCQPGAVSGDDDHDGVADDVNVGFDAEIAADHVGVEVYTGNTGLGLGEYTYVAGTGVITVGINGVPPDNQCWIVGPGDEDWADGGTPDNELEAQVFCYGKPLGLAATVDLDGDTDPDIMWWKVVNGPFDPTGQDNCPDDWNPEQIDTDGDTVGDACDDDDDADNYTDPIEWWVGTDPLDDCPQDVGKHDAWPLDINMSRDVSVTGDVFNYVGKIGCLLTVDLSCRRLDLNASGDVSVTGDVFQYVGKIGQTCTP